MQIKDAYLTNEKLKNKFKNKFDLVNYAIKLAKEEIGKEPFDLAYLLDRIVLEEIHE